MAEEAGTMGFIRDHAGVHWYPPGSYVLEQGEMGTELFMILSGRADVWQEAADGTRRYLRQMGPGEFFGELSVAYSRPRSANVVATEGLTCLVLSPAAPTLFAGRGEGANLIGAASGPFADGPMPAAGAERSKNAGADMATARLDVTGCVDAKVDALCAYRSQFPLEKEMYPEFLLRELFGQEYFIQVLPARPPETELL
jgi:hypothetical protein